MEKYGMSTCVTRPAPREEFSKQDLFINKKEKVYIYGKFEGLAVFKSLRYRVGPRITGNRFLKWATFRDGFDKMRHCVFL